MSKTPRSILFIFGTASIILLPFGGLVAQDIEATIRIDETTPNRVHVTGRFPGLKPARGLALAFTSEYANLEGLDKRVSQVRAFDAQGVELYFGNRLPGMVYAARSGTIDSWSYSVDLKPVEGPLAATAVSWMKPGAGVLSIDDFLPQDLPNESRLRSAKVRLVLPTGWDVFTAAPFVNGQYDVTEIEKAVFIVGNKWREKTVVVNGKSIRLLLLDEWNFSDDDATALVSEVFTKYLVLFGGSPKDGFQIAYHKFPYSKTTGEWEGTTNGSTIRIASSDMPFKAQSLQRLHEQLRHEIFHFWIPNGVNLTGPYDWFYEGFALYQSLKMGVAVNRIRFEDYLDTLSRAYDIDRRAANKQPLGYMSMLRWSDQNNSLIYARGMLVAFLSDLALLNASNGKHSSDELLREFYALYRPPAGPQTEGKAIHDLFQSRRELASINKGYVDGRESIEWTDLVSSAGLETTTTNGFTRLVVKNKLDGGQKRLLDKLGYNSWRKLSK